MREGGKRLAEILRALAEVVRPGMATHELEVQSLVLIKKAGCTPAFLNYKPGGAHKAFPASLCVSINEVVVHGVPSDYVIRDGDLVKLDLGVIWKGFYSDSAVTVGVGNISEEAKRLMKVTRDALFAGIREAQDGNTLGDIGWAIEDTVRSAKFSVADTLTGHGIGRELHEDPWVLNTGRPGAGDALRAGMVIAIEPMVVIGKGHVNQGKDDSFHTADGSLSAHFEHTVAITENGPQVLTE